MKYVELLKIHAGMWQSVVGAAVKCAGTVKTIADLCGVSSSAVHTWLKGTQLPSARSRKILVDYLDSKGQTWTATSPVKERTQIVQKVVEGWESQQKLLKAYEQLNHTRFNTIMVLASINLLAIGALLGFVIKAVSQ